MTADFFIRLILATHKVADLLQKEDPLRTQVQECANRLLASLVLLAKETSLMPEQKRNALPKAIREIGELTAYINYAKRIASINPAPLFRRKVVLGKPSSSQKKSGAWVNPENFVMLEQEYSRVGEFLRELYEDMEKQSFAKTSNSSVLGSAKEQAKSGVIHPSENTSVNKEELSSRQTRILEIMRNKPKVQVWELQKVLPQVTKRTLRRDLDDLLQRSFINRQGEWNEVSYQIR